MNVKSVSIEGRRWFQKSYGNTYHSVKVNVTLEDGSVESFDSGMHYGYGEGYDQTALEMMEGKYNIIVPRYENGMRHYGYLSRWARENNVPCSVYVQDVKRERDL